MFRKIKDVKRGTWTAESSKLDFFLLWMWKSSCHRKTVPEEFSDTTSDLQLGILDFLSLRTVTTFRRGHLSTRVFVCLFVWQISIFKKRKEKKCCFQLYEQPRHTLKPTHCLFEQWWATQPVLHSLCVHTHVRTHTHNHRAQRGWASTCLSGRDKNKSNNNKSKYIQQPERGNNDETDKCKQKNRLKFQNVNF